MIKVIRVSLQTVFCCISRALRYFILPPPPYVPGEALATPNVIKFITKKCSVTQAFAPFESFETVFSRRIEVAGFMRDSIGDFRVIK